MKQVVVLISLFFFALSNGFAQISDVTEKFALPNTLEESSGAIFFNDKLITHNDSGNENKLYELDTISGLVTREITISNATNTDWEDMSQDDTSIFIGDIGNNGGDRTDLKIYKINKADYLAGNSVSSEVINYSYADQSDFTTNVNNTIWDAEALVSFDANNLIVFTKNWVDGITKGYLVPKTTGTYSVSPLPTLLNANGLISGATFNYLSGKLYLVGYTNFLQPFVWECENFSGNDVFSGTNSMTNLTSLSFEQTEAITYVDVDRYFITSESFSNIISDYAKLIAFSTNDVLLSVDETSSIATFLYPNPVKDFLYFKDIEINKIQIYDSKLVKLYEGVGNSVNMTHFSKGLYLVKIDSGNNFIIKKIIKN